MNCVGHYVSFLYDLSGADKTPYYDGHLMGFLNMFSEMGLSSIIVQVVLGVIGLNLIFRVFRRKIYYVKVYDFTKGHSWCSIEDGEIVSMNVLTHSLY